MGFSSRPLVLALMLPLSWGVVSAKDCPENTGPTTIEEHRFDGPLPMTGYPSIKTIISSWASSKVKNELVKDEYETTSEFEKRKASLENYVKHIRMNVLYKQTSIWEESLYIAWGEILVDMVHN